MYTKPNTLHLVVAFFLVLGAAFTVSCNQQGRGFALPEGDIESGKAAFTRLGCDECHSVGDIAWEGEDQSMHVKLGGEVANKKTYGELVTSIINPSHEMSKRYAAEHAEVSPMTEYNEVMFVSELVDIVTFLQSEYELDTPPGYYAPYPH